jgi:hypothetical protein
MGQDPPVYQAVEGHIPGSHHQKQGPQGPARFTIGRYRHVHHLEKDKIELEISGENERKREKNGGKSFLIKFAVDLWLESWYKV